MSGFPALMLKMDQVRMCATGILNHLNSFYDEVLPYLCDAEIIQIFGPGEAKGQLKARLEKEGLKGRIIEIETTDKMTDHQIAAKVRNHN